MGHPKISVIICCYNVAKWLKLGRLNNVYNQTYQNWELLLIDDGSTDETPAIIDAEAKKESRVRAFHKPNGGAGSARNMAIDNATGEYICAFDIDDELKPDMLEYCVGQMEANQVDMLVFGLEVHELYVNKVFNYSFGDKLITSNQELRDNYLDYFLFVPGGSNGYFCNKCYRMSFLNKYHLRFENQRIQQDEVFNLLVYHYLEKCYISPRIFYIYYIYSSGNTRSRFIPDRFDIYKSVREHFEDLKSFWNLNDSRFDNYLDSRFYSGVMQCMIFNLTHTDCPWTKGEKKTEIARIMNDPLTLHSFRYAETHVNGIEHRLYRDACRKKSLLLINIYASLFRFIHRARKSLKG
jgi:glycosyltransferase involved in cell wall biosynthesis